MNSLSVIDSPILALKNSRYILDRFTPTSPTYQFTYTPSSYDALYAGQNAVEQVNKLSQQVYQHLNQVKSILVDQQNVLEILAKRQGLNLDTLA